MDCYWEEHNKNDRVRRHFDFRAMGEAKRTGCEVSGWRYSGKRVDIDGVEVDAFSYNGVGPFLSRPNEECLRCGQCGLGG